MSKRSEDTRVKGTIAEHLFIVKCARSNIEICQPVVLSQRYDFLVRINNKWLRTQIKYVSSNDGRIPVSKNKNQNGRHRSLVYTEDDIDLYIVYNPDTNEWYNIPFKEFNKVLVLRTDEPKIFLSTINYAKDYVLDFSKIA